MKKQKCYFKKVRYTIKNSKYDNHLTIYCFDTESESNEVIRVIRIRKSWLSKFLLTDLIEKISTQYKDNVIE